MFVCFKKENSPLEGKEMVALGKMMKGKCTENSYMNAPLPLQMPLHSPTVARGTLGGSLGQSLGQSIKPERGRKRKAETSRSQMSFLPF